jgi:hypothetical protein
VLIAVAELGLPVHAERRIHRDRELAPEPIEQEALDQLLGRRRLAIEQQRSVPAGPDEEVEQRLALRAQQSGIDRQGAGDVVCHEPLQELRRVLRRILGRDAHHRAREQAFVGHRRQSGRAGPIVKRGVCPTSLRCAMAGP